MAAEYAQRESAAGQVLQPSARPGPAPRPPLADARYRGELSSARSDGTGAGPRTEKELSSRIAGVAALPAADLLGLTVAILVTRQLRLPSALYALAVLAALAGSGLYRLRICLRVSDQAGRILAVAAGPLLLLLPWLSAGAAAELALCSAALVFATRSAVCAALRAAHSRGLLTEPALVVGAGTFGAYVGDLMREHAELGLRPQGYLDDGPPRRDLALPTLGTPGDLAEVVDRFGIRRVIVCPAACKDEDLVAVLRACRPLRADVCVVPRLYELGAAVPRSCLDEIWGIPLVPLRRLGHLPAGLLLKRAFDVSVAAVLLVAAAPVIAVLAVAIRLQSGQTPLFRQVRETGNGRRATVLKLRTLSERSDPDTTWAVNAAQCSRLGRWLRVTHLDELPQLVNVLRGEMSLVGPRPERPYFAEKFAREMPRYSDRSRMRAGITGWAQVNGLHGDTSVFERARFDNQYIEYWSPWLDVAILTATLMATFRRPGRLR
jgi:exopolysaccharide biosynthesis polyprenyl glycosylphosphotransferase